jgi:hypothetical protein
MKIRMKVSKVTALKSGKDTHGFIVVEVPAAALNPAQRDLLAQRDYYRYTNDPGPEADFYLDCAWCLSDNFQERPLMDAVTEATPESAIALLQALVAGHEQARQAEAARAEQQKVEKAAMLADHYRQQEQAIAELSALDDAALLADATAVLDSGRRMLTIQHRFNSLLRAEQNRWGGYPDIMSCLPAALPLAEKVAALLAAHNALADRQEAEKKQAKADLEAAALAEVQAWADEHGSMRLRRCLEEGIECSAIYRDERLAVERPGWRWEVSVPGDQSYPRNPPAEAFDLLDQARQMDPEAQLVRWTVERDDDDDQYDEEPYSKYSYQGYAATSTFLGYYVIFGGPDASE